MQTSLSSCVDLPTRNNDDLRTVDPVGDVLVYALEDPLCAEQRLYKRKSCPLVSPRGTRFGSTVAFRPRQCPVLVSATAVG